VLFRSSEAYLTEEGFGCLPIWGAGNIWGNKQLVSPHLSPRAAKTANRPAQHAWLSRKGTRAPGREAGLCNPPIRSDQGQVSVALARYGPSCTPSAGPEIVLLNAAELVPPYTFGPREEPLGGGQTSSHGHFSFPQLRFRLSVNRRTTRSRLRIPPLERVPILRLPLLTAPPTRVSGAPSSQHRVCRFR